ncbi:MAG: hypothetical protein J3K34DRAFT_519039 [Monoraphidium minutum]|nr:MAG: hypothetical protein J3K34DRAFT_519039 [Monoraphidium minutum]
MPLVYALVARCADAAPLVEHAAIPAAAGLARVAIECYKTYGSEGDKLDGPFPDERFSVLADGVTFNILVRGGFLFAVAADEGYGRAVPLAAAGRVADAWNAEAGLHAAPGALQGSFGPVLAHELLWCSAHADVLERSASQEQQVDELKGILIANMDSVMESLEKMDLAVTVEHHPNPAVAVLAVQAADSFKQQAAHVRSQLRSRRSLKIGLALVALVMLAAIVMAAVCFAAPGVTCFGGAGAPRQEQQAAPAVVVGSFVAGPAAPAAAAPAAAPGAELPWGAPGAPRSGDGSDGGGGGAPPGGSGEAGGVLASALLYG